MRTSSHQRSSDRKALTHATAIAALLAAIAISSPAFAGGGIGLESRYFLTSGGHRKIIRMKGETYIEADNQTGAPEHPLYIMGKIRTASMLYAGPGARYGQGLSPDGKTYTNYVADQIWDATSDGCKVYTVNFDTGDVIRADLDWSNPEILFTLDPAHQYLGITYDPSDHSLWVSEWDGDVIRNLDMEGNHLGSFTAHRTHLTCLGLDHATGLLWVGSALHKGEFRGYTRVGAWSGIVHHGFDYATYGGEFDLGTRAKLKNIIIRKGQYLEGAVSDLIRDDTDRDRIRSEERNDGARAVVCDLRFKSKVNNPGSLDVVVKGRMNAEGGTCTVLIKNWDTGKWDAVDAWRMDATEETNTAYNVPAADYINNEGLAKVRLRMVAEDGPDNGWKAYLNVVQLRARK